MRLKRLILIILFLAAFSCRKSNYVPPVYPPPPDSLINWTVIGNIPGIALEDIWFTSASKGFTLGDKIYQTVDGGATWSAVPNTPATYNFENLFFLNSQIGFAQGLSQLATTVDGGNSWTIKTLPTDSAQTIFFINPLEGFYGESGQGAVLKKTMDGGNNWENSFKDSIAAYGYYPYFLNSDTGFVATSTGTFASTTNGGQSWLEKTGILPENSYLPSNPNLESYNQLFFLDMKTGFYAYPSWRNENNRWRAILAKCIYGYIRLECNKYHQCNQICRCEYRLLQRAIEHIQNF